MLPVALGHVEGSGAGRSAPRREDTHSLAATEKPSGEAGGGHRGADPSEEVDAALILPVVKCGVEQLEPAKRPCEAGCDEEHEAQPPSPAATGGAVHGWLTSWGFVRW
jgi:hypothetical protein